MMWCWILLSWFVPFLKAQERVIYAQKGGTVIISRDKIEANKDTPYVNWYHESERILSWNPQGGPSKPKLPHTTLTPDNSLRISPVQESDFVLWRCEQHLNTNDYKQSYRLFHVTIPEVPTLVVGDSLSLQCDIEPTAVTPQITWIPPNADCNLSSYNGKKIKIQDTTRCHSGVWKCNLKYERRETEATITVYVIDLAPVHTVYTSVPSSSVNIPCSLSSQIPWSTVNQTGLKAGSWNFTSLKDQQTSQTLLSLSVGQVFRWDVTPEGKATSITGRELKDWDLSILNVPVSEKIRGDYNCSLKIKHKTLSSNVRVEVLKVLSSSGSSLFYEGQSVNLTCTLGHPNVLNITWKPPPSSSHSHLNSSHPSVFFIPEVRMTDKGRWICELKEKNITLTSAYISLKIDKAPVDVWLCVAIISGIVVFILLIVIIIIGVRRHKQVNGRCDDDVQTTQGDQILLL